VQFANSADIEAIYSNTLPEAYLGQGVTVTIRWVAQTATTGDVVWGISFERLNQAGVDLDDSPTWSTEKTVVSSAPGTSGQIQIASITFTDGAEMDSTQASENFRIRVRRLGDNGSDTMANAAQVLTILVSQAGAAGTLTVREQDGTPSVTAVTEIRVDNTKLTDEGSNVVSLDLSGGGGGSSLTVREEDGTPNVSSVTEIRVSNTKLTDNGSGSVSLDLSGGGGGGGFFSDGSGTNDCVGKGAVAPVAGGENSMAQGDNCVASGDECFALGDEAKATGIRSFALGKDAYAYGDRSFACGEDCYAYGSNNFAQGDECKIKSDLNNVIAQGFGQTVNYGTTAMGYGPWFVQGQQNNVDWESKYYYSTYGGGYYKYYSSGFVQGYSNTVSWRGNQQYEYHIGTTVIGSDNTCFGGLNFIAGAKNQTGTAQAGQSNNLNTLFGYKNYAYGSKVFLQGAFHEADASLERGHAFGQAGKIRFDAQYVWTSDRNVTVKGDGRSQVSQIVRHLNTTATGLTTLLTIPAEVQKSYMLKVEIIARLTGNNISAGIMALPTGASDQDGRYAIIDRDTAGTTRLRNATTTDATITLDTIVSYGSLSALTGQVSISGSNILVEVNPGTASATNFTARILLVEVGS
jgi:hypothetical protein